MTKPFTHQDVETKNLALKLDDIERRKIASEVCEEYQNDLRGRKEWEDKRDRYYKLWLGHREPKTTPWPGASNVALPLMAVACNQFHARSYNAFFNPPEFVKALPVEANDVARARNVQAFMNWQIMHDMEDFEEEHDKLLLNVPIGGANFIKGHYDREKERPVSEYISGNDVILPYRTPTLARARRVVHRKYIHYDELKMRAMKTKDFYVDFDRVQPDGAVQEDNPLRQTADQVTIQQSDSRERPKLLLESHKYYKFPWSKIPEPVVFTVDYDSMTLLRATSRVLTVDNKDNVINFFVDYQFLPNPEGFYSFGFGHFLEVLNQMADTAFNQIFDAGRLSNQPFGFYGRRAGLRRKQIQLQPGLMTEVEDASQIAFPSMQRVDATLFQVLGLIQQYSERFTSTSDLLLGREQRGVREPTATGTLAIIEQGLILYSVMIKRLFRAFKRELALIYAINQISLPQKKQFRVMGSEEKIAFPEIKRSDFKAKLDIVPVGDPSYASRLTRRQEAQELYGLILQNPLLGVSDPRLQVKNPRAVYEVTKDLLETYDKKNISNILPEMPPQPLPPDVENAMFVQGDKVDPKPGENHGQHLAIHTAFRNSIYYNDLAKERKDLFDEHIAATQALAAIEAQFKQQFAPAQAPQGGNFGAPGPGQPPGPAPQIGGGNGSGTSGFTG